VDNTVKAYMDKIINKISKFCNGLMIKNEIENCDDLAKFYSLLNSTKLEDRINVSKRYYDKIKLKYEIKNDTRINKDNDMSIDNVSVPFLDNASERYSIIKHWVMINNSSKWFGFCVNKSFRLLYFSLGLNTKYLQWNEETLTNNEKKEILLVLLKICKMTGSKQLIYYLNKWSPGVKSKGFAEYERTFGYWFNFKEDFSKNINVFMESTQYLMKFLKLNNLFMKNLNNYVKINDIINKDINTKLYKVSNDDIIVNEGTFPEANKNLYTKNFSYYKFVNHNNRIIVEPDTEIPIYMDETIYNKYGLMKSNNEYKYFENLSVQIENIKEIKFNYLNEQTIKEKHYIRQF